MGDLVDQDGEFGNDYDDENSPRFEMAANENVPMMRIPDYATTMNRIDPFASSSGNERTEKVLETLTLVGSTIGSIAKSAFHGTKHYAYTFLRRNNNMQTVGGFSSQDRIHEVDYYQHENLLLDPHEVEDGSWPMETSSPMGLRSEMMGVDSSGSNIRHPILACVKQFCVDMLDIFMGLSRNKKLVVIAFLIFLIWLFISEERQHQQHGSLRKG
jgi:hypothetical protein